MEVWYLHKISYSEIQKLKEFGDLKTTILQFKWIKIEKMLNQYLNIKNIMVEPLLSGIVLGLLVVTIAGLFTTAYLQYRRGDLATF